jgi:hypothetical protein
VTAIPVWKYLQTTGAISRQQQAEKRPIWNKRDRDAEQIRIILRDAGCKEFSQHRDGFVVEGGDSGSPFFVACTGIDEAIATEETTAYSQALKSAGFEVTQDQADDRILQVWAKQPC